MRLPIDRTSTTEDGIPRANRRQPDGNAPRKHVTSVGPAPRMYVDLSFLFDRHPRETSVSVGGGARSDHATTGGTAAPAATEPVRTVALSDGTQITFAASPAIEALEVT